MLMNADRVTWYNSRDSGLFQDPVRSLWSRPLTYTATSSRVYSRTSDIFIFTQSINVQCIPHTVIRTYPGCQFMSSIHKIYKYGNIAIEELFDIHISKKKYIYRGNDQMKKIASLFPSATRQFKTGKGIGDSQYC